MYALRMLSLYVLQSIIVFPRKSAWNDWGETKKLYKLPTLRIGVAEYFSLLTATEKEHMHH